MTPAIRTVGLVKDYGKVRALDGLDLAVESGQVFGFLGPNGAGKSTTIRLLLDLLRPTAGTVEVLGQSPREGGPALRARIGYLPGELGLPSRKTAGEYLHYLARLRGGRGAARIDDLAKRFGLELDEPTSSLDPLLQMEFRRLVDEARERRATVFLSSHVLAEVEEIAGSVAIVRAGRVVDIDDVRALRERAGQDVLIRFASPVDVAEFAGLPGLTDVVVRGTTMTCRLHGEPDALLRVAMAHHVVRWQSQDRDLEDLFMDFYRDVVPDDAVAPDAAPPPDDAAAGAVAPADEEVVR